MDSHKKPDSLLSFESLENGLLSTIGDFSDKNYSVTDEDLLMKQARNEEMSELPIDSVCSTSFDNDKEMDRDFHAWRRFQQKRMVREDGAEFLKSKIAELEKTMSLEKEQYENEIELLKYEKQVCL